MTKSFLFFNIISLKLTAFGHNTQVFHTFYVIRFIFLFKPQLLQYQAKFFIT